MRNTKARMLRNMAKRISKNSETKYDLGKEQTINRSNDFIRLNDGSTVHPGGIIEPGVPTVMVAECTRFIYKAMKKAYNDKIGIKVYG